MEERENPPVSTRLDTGENLLMQKVDDIGFVIERDQLRWIGEVR